MAKNTMTAVSAVPFHPTSALLEPLSPQIFCPLRGCAVVSFPSFHLLLEVVFPADLCAAPMLWFPSSPSLCLSSLSLIVLELLSPQAFVSCLCSGWSSLLPLSLCLRRLSVQASGCSPTGMVRPAGVVLRCVVSCRVVLY